MATKFFDEQNSKYEDMNLCQMIQIAWWTLIAEWLRALELRLLDFLVVRKEQNATPELLVSLLIYQHDGQYLKASPTFFMFAFRI